MKTSIIAVWILMAGVFSIVAQDLICSGNEPSWSVVFNRSDRATVTVPGDRAREFRGRETRNDLLKERIWRGRAGSRELVLFLRETACSDGMSDNTFPISARASHFRRFVPRRLLPRSGWVLCLRRDRRKAMGSRQCSRKRRANTGHSGKGGNTSTRFRPHLRIVWL
jgi:hypothetical protein